MAYSANNEQKLDFRIHGGEWEPCDLDGVKLVKRLFPKESDTKYKAGSKAVINHKNRIEQKKRNGDDIENYTVIDIETTGLRPDDRIIEIGALKIREGEPEDSFSVLVRCGAVIPENIVKLTGITDDMLD